MRRSHADPPSATDLCPSGHPYRSFHRLRLDGGRIAWWLKPLHEHLFADLKSSNKLFADETVMPVFAPRQVARGQLWAYARDDRPWGGTSASAVAYVYSPDRKQERPVAHLAGFTGVLQVDGYDGYNKIGAANDVTLAFCWAHGRRGFVEFQGKVPVADDILRASLPSISSLPTCVDRRPKMAAVRCSTPLGTTTN